MRRRLLGYASGALLLVDRRFYALVLIGLLLVAAGFATAAVADDRSTSTEEFDEIVGFERSDGTTRVAVGGRSVELGGDDIHLIAEQPVLEADYRYEYESAADRRVDATVSIDLVVERRTAEGVVWRVEEPIDTVSAEVDRGRISIEHPVSVDIEAMVEGVMDIDERLETAGELLDVHLRAELARETDAGDTTVRVSRLPIDLEQGRYRVDEPAIRRYEPSPAGDEGVTWLSYLGFAIGFGLLAVTLGARALGVIPLDEPTRARLRRRFAVGRRPRRFVDVAEPIETPGSVVVDDLGSLVRFARERRRPVLLDPDGLAVVYDDGTVLVHRPPVRD